MNLKFALIQATYWMTNCVFFNFLVLLLKDFGYSELQSGVISMVGTIVLTACQPLWGMLCDRAPRIKPILIGVLLAGAAASLLIPFGRSSVVCAVIAVILLSATTQSLMFLFDTWAARLLREGVRLNFGLTRSCGSFAYASTAALFGMALDRFGYAIVTPAFVALSLCAVAAVAVVREPARPATLLTAEKSNADFFPAVRRLLSDRRYLCLLLSVFLIFFGSTGIMLFYPLRIAELGGNNAIFGLAIFVNAASEVPALLLYCRLSRRFSHRTLLAVAFCSLALKIALIALSESLWLSVAVMLLQAPSYGVYLSASVQYVPEIVDARLTYTAQMLIGSFASGASGIASNLYMGVVADRFGIRPAMLSLILFALCGALLFVISNRGVKRQAD